MPYKVYKKGSGYKACKKNGKKCFSKKPLTKEKAQKQTKALYASEQQNESINNTSMLIYKKLYHYPKVNEIQVYYDLDSSENVLISLVYKTGNNIEEVDYIETRIVDSSIPNIFVFEDPQSEEAKDILQRYGLTGDDIENAGQEGYEIIEKYISKKDIKEKLEFEAYFNSLM
jgi:hypothetical protein